MTRPALVVGCPVLGAVAFAVGCGGGQTPAIDGAAGVDGPACPAISPVPAPPAAPPFDGTAFLDPDIITDADPTSLTSVTATGHGVRLMFDRRTDSFNEVDAWLFDARFGTATVVEIAVNPEFSAADAEQHARFYATAVGRLPAFLFRDLHTMWIHDGLFPFGGGNDNLLVHVDQGDAYVADGVLEEIFLHEGSHTSLDGTHAAAAAWLAAQAADGAFISVYAADNPTREDVAETLVPYVAQKFRADRVDAAAIATIRAAVPNRIRYLDCLGLTLDAVP